MLDALSNLDVENKRLNKLVQRFRRMVEQRKYLVKI